MKNDANDFLAQMRRSTTLKIANQRLDIFRHVVSMAYESIVNGSKITGAPGQPVDTGALRLSWQVTYESPVVALIATRMAYAPAIEDGISHTGKPLTLRSAVGGFHSRRLTELGADLMILEAIDRVKMGRA